jgi:hypothetical protein
MRYVVFGFVAVCALALKATSPPAQADSAAKRAAGVAAFEAITPVLHHPRCLVCHSPGDYPRQGDDLHRHIMDVRRGPHGDGADPVHCSTCHQTHNLEGMHTPPGAPDWHLPPPDDPLIWQGLTDRQLCELITDPKRNGGRDAKALEEHMHTPIVLWAWHPGEGRRPVSMPEDEFLRKVHAWTSAGTPCPSR